MVTEETVHSFSKAAKTFFWQNPFVGLVLGSDWKNIQSPFHALLANFSIVIKNCHGIHLIGNMAFAFVANLGPADFFSKKLLMEGHQGVDVFRHLGFPFLRCQRAQDAHPKAQDAHSAS